MINKCKICNKEILNDSQFIDGEWYHNECIKNIADKIEKQKKTLDKIKEYIEKHIVCMINGDVLAEFNIDELNEISEEIE